MADIRKRLWYAVWLTALLGMIMPAGAGDATAADGWLAPSALSQKGQALPAAQLTEKIVIDFDQDASGTDIPHLTLIDEQYGSWGIHFNGVFAAGQRAIAFPTYTTNTSLNMLCTSAGASWLGACQAPTGGTAAKLVVDLDFPVESASIEGRTRNDGIFDGDDLYIDAYDESGVFLERGYAIGTNNPPPWTTEAVLMPQVCAPGTRRLVIHPRDIDALDTLTLREAATPDLVLSKDDGRTSVLPTEILTYTLTVSNQGNQTASGVTVVDTLPSDTSFVAASNGGNEADGVVTWPSFDLPAGETVTRSVTVQVSNLIPEGVDSLTNIATVADDGSNCPDPTPDDNTAVDTDELVVAPNLALSKDDGQTTVVPGQIVTYTLSIGNIGFRDATGVFVTDELPALTSFVGASDDGAETDGVVSWPVFALAMGETVSRTATVRVADLIPAGEDTITNTATVIDDGSHGIDLNPADNTGNDVDNLEAAPDLVLSKDDGQTSVLADQTVTYTLIISNTGSQDAANVIVSDTLPDHTSFVAASDEGSEAGGVVTWPAFNLLAGRSATRTLTVQVDAVIPSGVDAITNTATASDDGANGADPSPDNNTGSDTDSLIAAPDLVLNKENGQTGVAAGELVTYTLRIDNTGSRNATGVLVTDELPAFASFIAASDGGSEAGGIVTWPAFDLAAGEAATRTLTVQVNAVIPAGVDTITNTGSATDDGANGDDPSPDNNTGSDTDSLNAAPDLEITKDDGGAKAEPGATLIYTLTYSNAGSQHATGIVITETVPTHTTFSAASSGAGWSCADLSPADTVCTASITSLNAGANGTLDFAVTVADPLPDGVVEISNTASIGDDGNNGPDQNPEDNQGRDISPVEIPATTFCSLYPIALSQLSLEGVAVGDVINSIPNGTQPGNFGWLSWTGDLSISTLVTSLTPPGDSLTYVNPDDPTDREVSIGDWVLAQPGVPDAQEIRQALDTLTTLDIIVPVWSDTQGTGSNARFQVASFALVRLTGYSLAPENRISLRFLGFAQCASEGTLVLSPQVTLNIERGTFTDTVRIQYVPSLPVPTGSYQNIGLFFEIRATYAGGSPAKPLKPYGMTVTYDQEDVPADVDEGLLGLYSLEGSIWRKAAASAVDTTANRISARPDHFSLWAALAGQQPIYLPLLLKGSSEPPVDR